MEDLKQVIHHFDNPLRKVKIGIVGKYTDLIESYKSLNEALQHGALHYQLKLESVYVDAEELTDFHQVEKKLKEFQGILVPGGFGERGIEGKIMAIQYSREKKVPYLGICLGMQLAIIESARSLGKMQNANSEEFSQEGIPIIHYMKGQSYEVSKGGSMRLGSYSCELKKGSQAFEIYGYQNINERHRHRLEVNNSFLDKLEEAGIVLSGINKDLNLVEVIERKNHPFFIGCQYHPEFKSKPYEPHLLFKAFIKKADQQRYNV